MRAVEAHRLGAQQPGTERGRVVAASRIAGEGHPRLQTQRTTTLFAAPEIATGKVTDQCYDRHGKAEFLDFLKKVARAYPRRELRVLLDNYHTHKHAEVNAWLVRNPRITLHFTPTSGSWLNLVEVFFGIITRQAIRRGSFDSVKELVAVIRGFIDGWNTRCHPFAWTKTADEVLPHATRQRTSDARH
ncbi:IS630 family transposase [Amycolatopsis sp. Hca4]|uniref:IS630 family transposase n=1 Tax=Amycolatopsis sp. Hca4 TaxID=2742131 RepID=UPI0020CB3DD5|nr:IS630 family transposase [Amycolatopsis sp. Hca4]